HGRCQRAYAQNTKCQKKGRFPTAPEFPTSRSPCSMSQRYLSIDECLRGTTPALPRSMRMPWNHFADVVIAHGKIQTSACFQLTNPLAVKLLPRGVVVDLERPEISTTLRDLGVAQ